MVRDGESEFLGWLSAINLSLQILCQSPQANPAPFHRGMRTAFRSEWDAIWHKDGGFVNTPPPQDSGSWEISM